MSQKAREEVRHDDSLWNTALAKRFAYLQKAKNEIGSLGRAADVGIYVGKSRIVYTINMPSWIRSRPLLSSKSSGSSNSLSFPRD